MVPRGLRLDPRKPDPLVWHTIMMDMVLKAAPSFDVIHFHTDVLQLALVGHCETALRLDAARPPRPAGPEAAVPPLSASIRWCRSPHSQRAPLPWANWRATVHHGLPLGLYSLHPQPQDYFAFVGRISPEKRADRAIEIAKACGTPLRIAAKVDPADRGVLRVHDRAAAGRSAGELSWARSATQAKNDFIGNARALLMPIDWPEPFGLVMIEAMACGTPVIAYRHGSVPEIIDEGVTGFIVENQEQAIAAARNIGRIDRRRCRQVFEQRFAARVMARRYLEVYRELVDARVPDNRIAA